MLESLKQPLKAGETYPLSLTFKSAGKVQAQGPVEGSAKEQRRKLHIGR
jgi:copper(I)-binding protein